MSLTRTVKPAQEPVELEEAKAHLRVDGTDDDTLINALISAARETIEEMSGRSFVTQTWRLNLDDWPESDEIELPRSPLQSVSSVVYLDEAGDSTTLSSDDYAVDTDSEPGRIVLKNNTSWPSVTLYAANPIQITFVAGYGSEPDVPKRWLQAMLLLIGHWYENREDTVGGTIIREVPMAVRSLVDLDRMYP